MGHLKLYIGLIIIVLFVLYIINAIDYQNGIIFISLNIHSYKYAFYNNILFWIIIAIIGLIGYFYVLVRRWMSYLNILIEYLKINYVWFSLLAVILSIASDKFVKFKNVSGYVMAIMILIGVILKFYPIYLFVISVLLIYISMRR